jgi:hypothetical protein
VSTPEPTRSALNAGFTGKRRVTYRFSILLIDDKRRIAIRRFYRITIQPVKVINMACADCTAIVARAAVTLLLCTIAIVPAILVRASTISIAGIA